ncbi:ankyrin repeat domain-containing protein 40-like [Saccoglossus kowalevskii]|uniref:Ankyrin repeat domain-containing protein 40-like n=1 Tax=Saccoglossus kowalevskii TaxID=10224 RepID=A0ABM0GX73_SACKO|nr:PREDICTED: ankyrin repeat domain-containing protein 40-like [Saccoglossus kowalevskii]
MEEKLREFACLGNEDGIRKLMEMEVDVNSQHLINGWTALHWSCKRNHVSITKYLLDHGANKDLLTEKGEKPVHLTTSPQIKELLGGNEGGDDSPVINKDDSLPITPSYLRYPEFPYNSDSGYRKEGYTGNSYTGRNVTSHELVLKVRVAKGLETDYIEVEIEYVELTYKNLLKTCAKELGINPDAVIKIRKLPNTIIRKDKDVQRLKDFQEIELVLDRKTPNLPNSAYSTTAAQYAGDVSNATLDTSSRLVY